MLPLVSTTLICQAVVVWRCGGIPISKVSWLFHIDKGLL